MEGIRGNLIMSEVEILHINFMDIWSAFMAYFLTLYETQFNVYVFLHRFVLSHWTSLCIKDATKSHQR